MFRRNHSIAHTGLFRCTCPHHGIIEIWIKMFEITLIMFIRQLFSIFYPLMASRQSIEAPMNEKTKTVMNKPATPCYFCYLYTLFLYHLNYLSENKEHTQKLLRRFAPDARSRHQGKHTT